MGEDGQRVTHGFKRGLHVVGCVQFVDSKHDAGHTQQMRQQAVAPRLWQELDGPRAPVDFGDVHQHHRAIAACRSGHHVACVLLVARRVGNDELACFGGEVAVGHVDGDALFALGFQAVSEQRQIYRCTCGALGQRFKLVRQNGLTLEQQTSYQGALAVVNTARCQEPQGAVGRGLVAGLAAADQCVVQQFMAMLKSRKLRRGVHQK